MAKGVILTFRNGGASTTVSGGTSDHYFLSNLDYTNSGHTGFASAVSLVGVSGTLQDNIDSKANINHNHTESDITDFGDYVINDVFITASGVLQNQINNKANVLHTHETTDINSFTEAVQDIIGSSVVGGGSVVVVYDDNLNIISISGSASGGETDHAQLSNLDYVNSGHTGFVSTAVLTSTSGSLQDAIDTKAPIIHTHDDRYYTENEVSSLIISTSGVLQTEIDNKSDILHDHNDLYYTEYETNGLVSTTSGVLQDNIDNKADLIHTHNDLYYTEQEVVGLVVSTSGTLQDLIDNKSDINHNHDDLYYNESEVFDLVNTTSGILQDNIDSKSDIIHNHNDLYYTEQEVIGLVSTTSGVLQNQINNKSDINHDHNDLYYTEAEVYGLVNTTSGNIVSQIITTHSQLSGLDYAASGHTGFSQDGHGHTSLNISDFSEAAQDAVASILAGAGTVVVYYDDVSNIITISGTTTSGGGAPTDHAQLANLTYATSGHIGFAPTIHTHTEAQITDLDKYGRTEIDTISGSLQNSIDDKADILHSHNDLYYTELETVGLVSTASGSLQSQIDNKADLLHTHDDRYYTESEIGVLITTTSGDIVDQIPSLVGYTTENYVSDNYINNSEMTTISGNIVSQIPNDFNLLYYTKTELNDGQLDTRYYTESEVDALIASASGTTNHADLNNLDYTNSGHTGFAPTDHFHTESDITDFGDYVINDVFITASGVLQDQIDDKAVFDHTHDDRYYTEAESFGLIITASGVLQDNIDNKADLIHTHNDLYYTEAESVGLVTSASGVLQSQINNKADLIHDHNDLYYTEVEVFGLVNTTSGVLQSQIDDKSDSSHVHTGVYEPVDITILRQADVDDAPVDGVTTAPISSNWAYDHANDATAHGYYITSSGVTYESLAANGDVGNSADQVAVGNHNHDSSYYTEAEVIGVITTTSGILQDQIDDRSVIGHTHDDRYYTEDEVVGLTTTVSGYLQTQINNKSESTHTHDDRYYTETELDNGQLDNRYYTETETRSFVITTSGVLQSQIDDRSVVGHTHDDRYYTESEVDALLTGISGSIATDHSALQNLDYDNSGHTGFAPTSHTHSESDITDFGDYVSTSVLTSASGSLQSQIDDKSDSDHTHDDRYYTEAESVGLVNTVSGILQNQINNKADLIHDHNDLYYTENEVIGLVNTTSGILQNQINNKAASSHTHDDLYYTETELNNGQLDSRYYTELEVDIVFTTTSGFLQSEIDSKSDDGHSHNSLYYTETELDSGQLDNRYYTETETSLLLLTTSGTLQTQISNKSDTGHTHTENDITDLGNYATVILVTTTSGMLQDQIDGKADSSHNHDDIYYTETELNNGQLDSRYYTELEVGTISGSLQSQINTKSDSTHDHDSMYYTETELNNGQLDNRYYTEAEIVDIITTTSGALQNQINDKSNVGHTHVSSNITDFDEAAQDAVGSVMSGAGNVSIFYDDVSNTITISGSTTGGGTNHAELSNLDYASSGHTGFSSDSHVHGSIVFTVTQATHGFSVTNAVYHTGSDWAKAQADDVETLGTHIVVAVADVDNFTLCQVGRVTVTAHGLTVGQFYYVSDVSAGGLVTDSPSYSNPIVYVEDDNTLHVLPYRPSNEESESIGNSLEFSVEQNGHGFSILNAVYHTGVQWVKAIANDGDTLGTHVVISVADSDNFTLCQAGRKTIAGHGLTPGDYYFVSDTASGTLTDTSPIYSNPLLFVESVDIVHILPFRPSNEDSLYVVSHDNDYHTTTYTPEIRYETVYIPAAAMVPTVTAGAAADSNEYATNDVNRDYLAFDGATAEYANFSMVFPDNWDTGTIRAKFHWSSATSSTAGDGVRWTIKARAAKDDDAIDGAYGTAVGVTDGLLANNGTDHQISGTTDQVTIGNTPTAGCLVDFSIYRLPTHGDDNMTEDAWLFGVVIQYKVNSTITTEWS